MYKKILQDDLPLLVTGAEGFTGKFVCMELIKRGIFFKASIKPNKSKKWFLDRNIEAIETDIYKKDQLIKSLKGCKGLININSIGFGAAPIIIKSCLEVNLRRVIFISSTSIFTSLNSKSKSIRLKAEQSILQSNLDWTILRPTMIYGSKNDRNMIKLIKYIDRFLFIPIIGNGRSLQQPVFVGDLAWAIVEAFHSPKTIHKKINISGGDKKSFNEIIDIISKRSGKKIIKVYFPKSPIILLMKILENFFNFRLPIKAEQIERLNEDKNFSHSFAKKLFNYSPLNFEEGIGIEIFNYKKAK